MPDRSRLDGRVAVVTGGGRGIGRAACHELVALGASVAVVDVDAAEAERVTAELGPGASAHAADVTDVKAVARAVEAVLERHGRIDALVACAGIMRRGRVTELSAEDWDAVIASHLRGAFACVRAVAPGMAAQGRGRIVLVSSVAARGLVDHVAYAAAKAGIEGMTRSLALELGPQGITVNAVAPGFIDTRLTRGIALRTGQAWEEVAAAAGAETALGRIGTPGDVAGVIGFFCSDAAAFVTGQVLVVSGSP